MGKMDWDKIKVVVLLLLTVFMYGFSDYRNEQRKQSGITVKFLGDNDLYMGKDAVNKLLIQNGIKLGNEVPDRVVLNTVEAIIASNPMVKSAQVYRSVEGELISEIVQRNPIGRVEGVNRFYLDDEGKRMPLSKRHSARVPVITGEITGRSLEDAYEILDYVNRDEFLRKNIIGIHIVEEGKYELRLRTEDFVVSLGNVDNLDEKFKNFMAFYVKATKDNTLRKYAMVNLEFEDQVVCTKI